MRILLTQRGEAIITVLEEEKKMETKESTNNNTVLNTQSKIRMSSKQKGTNSKSMNTTSMVSNITNSRTKSISINQNKISMPKVMSEKYQQGSPDIRILPNLPERISKKFNITMNNMMNNQSCTNQTEIDEGIKFKDILNTEAYIDLKLNIKNRKKYRDKLSFITENNFRSVYQPKTEIELINDKLETSFIGTDKMNIIRYINEKPSISSHLINKICSIDEHKQNKLNKICHVLSKNKEREELNKMLIQEKLRANIRKLKTNFEEELDGADNDLTRFIRLTDTYKIPKKSDRKKEIFNKFHNEFKEKFWNKTNVNYLQRKNNLDQNKQIPTDS